MLHGLVGLFHGEGLEYMPHLVPHFQPAGHVGFQQTVAQPHRIGQQQLVGAHLDQGGGEAAEVGVKRAGFDGSESAVRNRLTSAAQPLLEMGIRGIDTLVMLLQNPGTGPVFQMMNCPTFIGETT